MPSRGVVHRFVLDSWIAAARVGATVARMISTGAEKIRSICALVDLAPGWRRGRGRVMRKFYETGVPSFRN
jgi:hypothetical protein